MKKIFKASIKALVIAIIALTATQQLNAQGNPGGPDSDGSSTFGNGNPVGSSSPAVPFDGGLSLILLASGIGYGTKKLRNR